MLSVKLKFDTIVNVVKDMSSRSANLLKTDSQSSAMLHAGRNKETKGLLMHSVQRKTSLKTNSKFSLNTIQKTPSSLQRKMKSLHIGLRAS
jgi:hypothetical protein